MSALVSLFETAGKVSTDNKLPVYNAPDIYDGSGYSLGANYSPVPSWGFGIAIVGAILLFLCFVPGFIQTLRTRDTSQMSLMMWIITFVGLTFLVLFYAMGMAKSTDYGTKPVSSQFTVVFTCEFGAWIMSVVIFVIKIINMVKAKSLGISEAEYCARHTVAKK